MKKNLTLTACIASLFAAGMITSCTPYQQQGAAVGALAGGAFGAITGNDTSDVIRGAAVGAAIGTAGAAYRERGQNGTMQQQQSPPTQQQAPATTARYPYGIPTSTPGIVKSPYSPHNKVNVQGIPSGKMVKEPGTEKIFLVP